MDAYKEMTDTLAAEDAASQRQRDAERAEQDRAKLVSRWQDKIKRARKHDQKARERWADDRKVARGESDWLVDTNLIGAILEVLAAFLYARNPDISIKPSPSANRKMLKEYRAVSETLEIMVSRMLRDAGLKRIAKRWVRAAMTVGVSWIKVGMQMRTDRDAMSNTSINDLTDNLKRIEALRVKLESDDCDHDATRAELEVLMRAIQGQMERQVAEGLTLDLMAPEDVLVAPECGEVENYLNSPWIAFDLYKDIEEAVAATGWKEKDFDQANRFKQRPRKGEEEGEGETTAMAWYQVEDSSEDGSESASGFLRFTEIWSLRDGVVLTYVDGITDRWGREPYAPATGKRFYPSFLLAFHPVDGERWPQSDVCQLKKLQDEYARTRSNFAEHRKRAVPGILFDETSVDPDSVKNIVKSETQEYVGVKSTRVGQPLQNHFYPKPYSSIDMGLYSTEPITQEMEKVSGAQDAVQGGIQVEKTATEAQILESGRGARTGARLDALEDVLTEMAEYATQLALLRMDRADAMRYAGPEAVWVDMTTEEALTLFSIEIKAGSTGKPKANSDREAWGTLMPLIEKMIDRIGHARMQGQEWAAKPWIALLQESFNRLDDHADIEKFLPSVPKEVIAAMSNKEMTEQEKAELENTDADTLKNLSDALKDNPLFIAPVMMQLAKMNGQGQPTPEAPAVESAPAAPNPLPNEIN